MSKVEGYGVYQNKLFQSSVQGKKTGNKKNGRAGKADRSEKAQQKNDIMLSEKAQQLLKELQAKYGDMDFFVADYSSEEEAQSYLSRGTKAYSVLIDPETLEAMAADENTKKQYLDQIDGARTNLEGMMEELKESGEDKEVKRVGITIGNDGKISYFAELQKMGDRYSEHIEEVRERRREEKAEAEKAEERRAKNDRYASDGANPLMRERVQRTTVRSDTVEGLLEQIRNVDWSHVGSQLPKGNGDRFDFSI